MWLSLTDTDDNKILVNFNKMLMVKSKFVKGREISVLFGEDKKSITVREPQYYIKGRLEGANK